MGYTTWVIMSEMALTHYQKNYIKRNVRRLPLAKIAADLNVPEKEILQYLQNRWQKEKYQKFVAGQKEKDVQREKGNFQWKNWLLNNWKILVFLAFLAFAVYLNSLANEFVSDDISGIAQNKSIINPSYIVARFPFTFRAFVYFITYKIVGANPFLYRLTNVIFHIGVVWLVYFLVNLTIRSRLTAIFTSTILAVHPILIESVTWVSGGVHAQYSFFFLLALISYILSKNYRKMYVLSIFAFILSLSSSEKAVSLFLIFFLFEVSFGNLKNNWRKLIPFTVISVIFGLFLTGLLGERVTALESGYYTEPGFYNPFVQIPIAITSYLQLILWPKDLSFYHSEMAFSQGEYFIRLGIFISFLIAIVYFFKKDRRIFFWLLFFLISLLPTITPFKISWIVAERYVYLGSIGIIVIAALLLEKIGELIKNQKVSLVLLFFVVILLSMRTITRNTDWKRLDTLWLSTAKTSPSSPQNHNNLGDYYSRQGNLEKASEEFKLAIKLQPNYGDAYHNLANAYQQMGKTDLAIENYQKALSFNPSLWQSHQNLAAIYFAQQDLTFAENHLQKAIAIEPKNTNLWVDLGVVYLKEDNKNKARESFLEALKIDPGDFRAKKGFESTN